MKTINIVLVSLLFLVKICIIVFIFWVDKKNISGAITGVTVAIVAPLFGLWFINSKYIQKNNKEKN